MHTATLPSSPGTRVVRLTLLIPSSFPKARTVRARAVAIMEREGTEATIELVPHMNPLAIEERRATDVPSDYEALTWARLMAMGSLERAMRSLGVEWPKPARIPSYADMAPVRSFVLGRAA